MSEKKLEPKEADNGKYGYVDEKGNWVIKPKFDDACDFEDGIARVELDEKYGLIKTDGTYLFEPKFDDIEDFEDGIARVELDEKYGLIKTDGTYLVEPKFDDIEDFEDGIARVELDEKYGFIKTDGTYLFEPKFDDIEDFEDGIAWVLLDEKWGLIKTDGTYLFEPKFDEAGAFNDGLSRVIFDGKDGYIKTDGTYLVEPKFDWTDYKFFDGIARVELDEKYGFIKEDGTYLVEPKFDKAEDFHKGEAEVLDNGLYKILLADGTFKKMTKMEEYVLSCKEIQNWDQGGWSFLEASKESGEWQFESWSRNLGYSDSDHVYFDEIIENTNFANWANSLNLSTDKEIAELLWANAQQLINDLKSYGNSSNYDESARKLNIMIQLYWQLKNIYELGFQNTRKDLGLPKEEEIYLNPGALAEYGKKFCKENLEWGYESLWDEVIGWSHTPKHFHFRNWGDYWDAAGTISGGLDNRDDDDEDEDWDEEDE